MQWMPNMEVFEMWSDMQVDLHLGDVEWEQKKKEIIKHQKNHPKKLLWKRRERLEGRLI